MTLCAKGGIWISTSSATRQVHDFVPCVRPVTAGSLRPWGALSDRFSYLGYGGIELLEECFATFGIESAFQFFEGQRHDIVVMQSCVAWVGRDFQPHLVQQFYIAGTEAGFVGAERIFMAATIGANDFHRYPGLRFRQPFPGVPR